VRISLPECLGDWVEESNPVRAVDVFVEALDLADLGLTVCGRWRRAGPPIIPRRCSSSTFTATSTACNRAGGWSARPAVIWRERSMMCRSADDGNQKKSKWRRWGVPAVPRRVLSETRSDRLCLVERSDFIRAESAEWGRVVRQANIKIDQNGVWPSAPRVAICQRVCTPFKYVMPRRGIDDQKQPLACWRMNNCGSPRRPRR
jgi:hypothetical protein